MRLILAFATADAAFLSYVRNKRNGVIPTELRNQGYWKTVPVRFDVQINEIGLKTPPLDIGQWLQRLASITDMLILIIDESLRNLVHDYEDAYFVVSRPQYPGQNLQNELRALLAPTLRQFAAYAMRFAMLRNRRPLLLPFDIFLAPELNDLRQRMTADKMEPNLAEDLDELLSELNRRAKPKRKNVKAGDALFLVDDRPLYYRYGPEHHALPGTASPPHHHKCSHNSLFRFGCSYDPGLHHNVDDGGDPSSVSGSFTSCHGQAVHVHGKTHLNIFPNGHI